MDEETNMKYLSILLTFLVLMGCTRGSVDATPRQIGLCEELGFILNMKASIGRTGGCELKSELLQLSVHFKEWGQVEGAIQMLELQRDVRIRPFQKACRTKCTSRIPKNVCDTEGREWRCVEYCNSADGLDTYLTTGHTPSR